MSPGGGLETPRPVSDVAECSSGERSFPNVASATSRPSDPARLKTATRHARRTWGADTPTWRERQAKPSGQPRASGPSTNETVRSRTFTGPRDLARSDRGSVDEAAPPRRSFDRETRDAIVAHG